VADLRMISVSRYGEERSTYSHVSFPFGCGCREILVVSLAVSICDVARSAQEVKDWLGDLGRLDGSTEFARVEDTDDRNTRVGSNIVGLEASTALPSGCDSLPIHVGPFAFSCILLDPL
jgi:hypothetical protein